MVEGTRPVSSPNLLFTSNLLGGVPEPTTVYSNLAPVISLNPLNCSSQTNEMEELVVVTTVNELPGSGGAIKRNSTTKCNTTILVRVYIPQSTFIF